MSLLLLGIRHSVRSFIRTPSLTFSLLLTIAVGIGGNGSVHAFIRGLTTVSSSPLASISRLVAIFSQDALRRGGPVSYHDYELLAKQRDVFEWLGAALIAPHVVRFHNQSAPASVAAISSNLATFLHLDFGQGAILGHRFWQTDWSANSSIPGGQIQIDDLEARVSDIAPASLEGLYRDRGVDLWMPLPAEIPQAADQTNPDLWVLARLRPGVSISEAQNAIHTLLTGRAQVSIFPYTGMTPETSGGLSRIGALLGFAATLVFFTACANVASFLLGRAFSRSHETSLRIALGASRYQLTRELLWDSLVISIAGGACGLLAALWTSRIVPAMLFEEDAQHLSFAPDPLSLIVWAGLSVAITIMCGLLPAFVIPNGSPATVIRRESAGPSLAIQRFRGALVVAQMASCCVLVVSTAFLFNGFHAALRSGVGRRLGNPILATVQVQPAMGVDTNYFQQVEHAARSVKGVSSIVWVGRPPGSPPMWQSFRVEPSSMPLQDVNLDIGWFTPDSLDLFVLPPKSGHMFGFTDQGCPNAIVNEQAAKILFDGFPVGRAVQDPVGQPVQIIGVVATRKAAPPTIYYNHSTQATPAPDQISSAHFRVAVASPLARAELDTNVVSANYLQAMGFSSVTGAPFSAHPPPGVCRIGIVNEQAVALYFKSKAVGATIIDDQGQRTEIVGVVHSPSLGAFERQAEPAVYFPMPQGAMPQMTMIVAMRSVTGPMLSDLRRRIESVPGHGPAPLVLKTLDEQLSQTALAPLRIATVIIGASASMALGLSLLSLFAALSDSARHRHREFALRIALGAQRWRVFWQVLKQGGRLACAGAFAGTFGSFLLSRLLARITQGAAWPPLWVWLTAPTLLAVAVFIASVLPARRALMVNPVTIMRDET